MKTNKQILYSVYPPTKWRIQLLQDDAYDFPIDSFEVTGLDSDRNYLPQEVIDFIDKQKKQWFSPYKVKSNYIFIQVWRNNKWNTVWNWPMEKFKPTIILPHKHLLKELYENY